jgi:hypothetical protein
MGSKGVLGSWAYIGGSGALKWGVREGLNTSFLGGPGGSNGVPGGGTPPLGGVWTPKNGGLGGKNAKKWGFGGV